MTGVEDFTERSSTALSPLTIRHRPDGSNSAPQMDELRPPEHSPSLPDSLRGWGITANCPEAARPYAEERYRNRSGKVPPGNDNAAPDRPATWETQNLWHEQEKSFVAFQGATGCGHHCKARSRSGWHRGSRKRIGLDGKVGGLPIERNAGGSRESLSKDCLRPPHDAQVRVWTLTNGPRPGRKAEYCAIRALSASITGGSVEVPVSALNEHGLGPGTIQTVVCRQN
jgi:hypothetical protein